MTSGIQLILAGLAIFGFLPLAIILYKRNRVKKILTTGSHAKATVYEIRTLFRPRQDLVYYSFYPGNSTKPSTGKLSTAIGQFRKGDVLDIYYLPEKPHLNTMEGAWKHKMIVVFGIVIALAILFAVYKIYGMVESGQM